MPDRNDKQFSPGSELAKVPPQVTEAEQSVLGSILIENESIHRVIEVLRVEDFYREAHRKIFQAMLDLNLKGEPVDLLTLSELLKTKGELDEVGGHSYLAQLADSVPTAANLLSYTRLVKDKAVLRGLMKVATGIVTRGYEADAEVEQLLDQAEREIFAISERKFRPSYFPIKEIIKENFKTIDRLYSQKGMLTGVPTGLTKFDELTCGLQPSELIVIAGRPAMGKSALALNIAEHAAVESKIPVVIFSLEMSREQVGLRLLCSRARINSHNLRRGMIGRQDTPRLVTAAGILSDAPIFVDDSPTLSVLELRAKSRRLRSEQKIGLVVVDYLQLMRSGRQIKSGDTREQEISEISRSLKSLAKELSIPVVALSQLNRMVEQRRDKKPILADLRESGAIEQDADLIAFIYRDEVYNSAPDNPKRGIAEIIIGKQRNGPAGILFEVAFLSEYSSFVNLARDAGETYPED
ncbi:MAG: replicative DNA helicase [Proteobacteria bacterium]|jgi:replicative DNA helicase|nr:replicative DNA helicase [Pseudomonadota bacterium]